MKSIHGRHTQSRGDKPFNTGSTICFESVRIFLLSGKKIHLHFLCWSIFPKIAAVKIIIVFCYTNAIILFSWNRLGRFLIKLQKSKGELADINSSNTKVSSSSRFEANIRLHAKKRNPDTFKANSTSQNCFSLKFTSLNMLPNNTRSIGLFT